MRKHFNDPAYAETEMRTNPHYNLVEVTSEVLDTFATGDRQDNLLFSKVQAIPLRWQHVQKNLTDLNSLLEIPNLIVAGGKVFSAIFGTYTRDVDIFLWGLTQETAFEKAQAVISEIIEMHGDKSVYSLNRTENAISVRVDERNLSSCVDGGYKHIKTDYQIILRLYKSPSEILHGFDVDSCCLGYDGQKIWATQRAIFSLTHGYNTVNFGRLSPSYEYRLVKYATRGLSIFVPDFDQSKLTTNKYMVGLTNMNGLDLLLQADMYWRSTHYAPEMVRDVLKSIPKVSDYNPEGPKEMPVKLVLEYMLETADKYPTASQKYLPYLDDISYRTLGAFSIPNPFKKKQITYWRLTDVSRVSIKHIQNLLEVNSDLHHGFGVVAKWRIPRIAHFKESNPGEQMTNTFHQLVLTDRSVWYNGQYYQQ